MRIARLDLLRYGRFTDRSLRFAAGGADIHVICGPNEAGKSTAKSAIEDLLFGFGRTSPYDFLHEASVLRVGAILEDAGRSLDLRRRKGNKDTLLGPDESPLAGDPLRAFLGGADRDVFARMWSLDHARLREGGRQILDAKDDVGRMLFEAGVGLGGLRGHLDGLEKDADAIFAPRASATRSFYVALGSLKAAESRSREATTTARDWLAARNALEALTGQRQDLLKSLGEKKPNRVRLERIRRVLPVLAEVNRIESEIRRLGDPAILPADAATALQAAERDQLSAEQRLRQLEEHDQETALELERLVVDEALLSREAEIDVFGAQRGAAAKARADVARRRTALAENEKRLAGLLREIDREPLALSDIEALLPARPKVSRLRELLEARSGLDAAVAAAVEEKRRSADDQADLQRQIEAKAALPDPAPLAAAAQAARARSSVGSDLRREERGAEKLDAQLASTMMALRPFEGDAASLRALPVPADARIEATRARLVEIAARSREVDGDLEKADRALTEQRRAKQQLLRTGTAVALETITSARETRSRAWTLVRRRYVEGLAVEDTEVIALAGDADLPGAFEKTMQSADEVSDRRFTGAQDSARLVEVELRIDEEEGRRLELDAKRRALVEKQEAVLREWAALWSTCSFAPETPEVMAEWTKRRASAIVLLDEGGDKARQVAALRAEDVSLRAQLLGALASAAPDIKRPDDVSLVQALAEADERLRTLAAETAEQKSLSKQMQKATTQVANAQRKLEDATQALAGWESSWKEAVERAGRPPGEAREATRAALAVFDEIRDVAGTARGLTDQIRKITEDETSFDETAQRLSVLLGAPGEKLSADAVAGKLADAVKANRQRKTAQDTHLAARAKRLEERARAEEQRLKADSQIGQLLRAAKCASVDELRLAIERAQRHEEYRGRIEQELARLAEAGSGATRDALERECEGADRDRMPAEIDELGRTIDSEGESLRAVDLKVAEAQRVFSLIAGDDVAGVAAAERQLALSAMQDEAQRYAKVRAAHMLLRWAIERYRQTKQAPLLTRAAVLFRSLTLDAFTSLTIEVDADDKPVLFGVRSEGTRVPVGAVVDGGGMSDGTVDQLYLALRLAAIDEHLAAGSAMPLVADDLFINFDDARAAAGFRVLADVARRSQVLFFTHHEHLVKVATDAIGRENLVIHQL